MRLHTERTDNTQAIWLILEFRKTEHFGTMISSNIQTQLRTQNNITKNGQIVYTISSKLISGHTRTSSESLLNDRWHPSWFYISKDILNTRDILILKLYCSWAVLNFRHFKNKDPPSISIISTTLHVSLALKYWYRIKNRILFIHISGIHPTLLWKPFNQPVPEEWMYVPLCVS